MTSANAYMLCERERVNLHGDILRILYDNENKNMFYKFLCWEVLEKQPFVAFWWSFYYVMDKESL